MSEVNEPSSRKMLVSEMRDLVMGYLSDRPNSMDTLEGIARFWLSRQRVRIEVRLLSEVLENLVEQGILERFDEGEEKRYRLHRKSGSPLPGEGR